MQIVIIIFAVLCLDLYYILYYYYYICTLSRDSINFTCKSKRINHQEPVHLFYHHIIAFYLDRGCDGKLVAVDIFHLDGHPWSFLRDESNSRCVIRVSVARSFAP